MALRATTKITAKEKEEPMEVAAAPVSQRTRQEERYRLQVDRQTKRSFTTMQAAEEAGAVIKLAHKIVQVSVYDAVDCINTMIGEDGKPIVKTTSAA